MALRLSRAGQRVSNEILIKDHDHATNFFLSTLKGIYSIELVNDSLYEWNVRLKGVDKDSPLYNDLITLKEREGKDYILLNVTFKVNGYFYLIRFCDWIS